MSDEEAINILANCIDDYVIGEYCVGKHCIDENMCKDKDCPFHKAIETALNLIKTQQKEIEKKDKIINEMAIALYDEWYMPSLNTVEKIKEYFINKVEKENKCE